jgi:heptosyltransferase-2
MVESQPTKSITKPLTNPAMRILVAGPAWVGDMVMAQSLFISLKQADPQTSIDVLAPAWSEPLLKRMPQVDASIIQPVGHGKLGLYSRYKIGKSLRQLHYFRAIVIPRSYKAALIPFFAKVPIRTGYKGEMRYAVLNDFRPLDRSVLRQTVQRYVALGKEKNSKLPPEIPYPRLTIDRQNQIRLIEKLELNRDRPIVVMMPGAEYGPAKQWPIDYFSTLVADTVGLGHQVWILGSDKDGSAAKSIIKSQTKHVKNLCGKTTLEEVIDLLALAKVAVTNDSGLMHVAAAVGINLIAIYGSSTPEYTPPLSDSAVVLYKNLDCSPCFKRECPLGRSSGYLKCLNDIKPTDVIQAMEKLEKDGAMNNAKN